MVFPYLAFKYYLDKVDLREKFWWNFKIFFNWKRITFEFGNNYIFNPKASGYLSDLISMDFGYIDLTVLQSPQAHWHCGPLACAVCFWNTSLTTVSFTSLDFLLGCHTLLKKIFLDYPIKKSTIPLFLLCTTLLRSPYHCLTWWSAFISFLFFSPIRM